MLSPPKYIKKCPQTSRFSCWSVGLTRFPGIRVQEPQVHHGLPQLDLWLRIPWTGKRWSRTSVWCVATPGKLCANALMRHIPYRRPPTDMPMAAPVPLACSSDEGTGETWWNVGSGRALAVLGRKNMLLEHRVQVARERSLSPISATCSEASCRHVPIIYIPKLGCPTPIRKD